MSGEAGSDRLPCPEPCGGAEDPAIAALVRDIIGQIADRWTLLILEALEDQGTLRFTEIARHVGGISQKMLTKTVRQMERDGLLTRTVHPVVPPRVDYALTDLGRSLGGAFCGVWIWAESHHAQIERARCHFDERRLDTMPNGPRPRTTLPAATSRVTPSVRTPR